MNEEISAKLISKLGANRVRLAEPLSLHTYMKVGGPAEFYYEALTAGELEEVVRLVIGLQLSYTVIGQGANVLVADLGIQGLVVVNKSKEIKFLRTTLLKLIRV